MNVMSHNLKTDDLRKITAEKCNYRSRTSRAQRRKNYIPLFNQLWDSMRTGLDLDPQIRRRTRFNQHQSQKKS